MEAESPSADALVNETCTCKVFPNDSGPNSSMCCCHLTCMSLFNASSDPGAMTLEPGPVSNQTVSRDAAALVKIGRDHGAAANDKCTGANVIACGGSIAGSTVGASVDDVGFYCGNSITTPGVWYKVSACPRPTSIPRFRDRELPHNHPSTLTFPDFCKGIVRTAAHASCLHTETT